MSFNRVYYSSTFYHRGRKFELISLDLHVSVSFCNEKRCERSFKSFSFYYKQISSIVFGKFQTNFSFLTH